MATYKYADNGTSLKVTDRPVYGSSRIGSFTRQMELMGEPAMHQWPYTQPMQAPLKRYELTDHLGNVAAVVTGRLLPGNGSGASKQAELVSAQGYEPFGSLLPGRNFSSDSYRFGFNGKENDNEVFGATGTFQDYGMRAYDTRVGRFISVDPIASKFPMLTPYQFASNNPIWLIDLDGKEGKVPDFFNDALQYASAKVCTWAAEQVKEATLSTVKSLTHWSKEHVEVTPYISGTFTYSIGARFAGEVNKVAGVDVNMGSVQLVQFSGEFNFKTKRWTGNVNYVGKDGKVIASYGASGSAFEPFSGVPVGAGVGYSGQTTVSNSSGDKEYSNSGDVGVGVGIFNVTGTYTGTTNNKNNRRTDELDASVGTEGSLGIGASVDYSIQTGVRTTITSGEDNED